MELSGETEQLYNEMVQKKDHLFSQDDLQNLITNKDPRQLMSAIQQLSDHDLVKIVQKGGDILYQVISREDAAKLRAMSAEESMVFRYIEASGRDGIWTKTIRAKSNLHQSVVQRCLRSLESKMYIKAVKSVKTPTRKIYMLASLQPSIELTGGPWFTDSELDQEFIDGLLNIIWLYIVSQTFPNATGDLNDILQNQQLRDPTYRGYPNIQQIHRFVKESNVATVELSEDDVKALCEVLLYDGKVDYLHDTNAYYATLESVALQQQKDAILVD
ncbi:hypothetical protein CANCADRAFT_90529 [Tortispora caseinolytica NRRL Y-17796]|uniref:DNA-directed RNA polymerase III subunit RPC6 n=1 Tax=Tortispora caseinolytica NRRL Y-17796 TaxID=767744 RepID=A0A1E4TLL5_9ASCO|nr:hypothetical protein CANCADRAFT_90529 [Tortispora caseinolytica NRRL Y-17796]